MAKKNIILKMPVIESRAKKTNTLQLQIQKVTKTNDRQKRTPILKMTARKICKYKTKNKMTFSEYKTLYNHSKSSKNLSDFHNFTDKENIKK